MIAELLDKLGIETRFEADSSDKRGDCRGRRDGALRQTK